MESKHRPKQAEPPVSRWLLAGTRREFLIGIGASAAAFTLAGCGGSGDSPASPVSIAGVTRTKAAGTLTNQVNQFSAASENIGAIWDGSSPTIANLQTFANGGNRASRAATPETRVMFQAVWYSLTGLRSSYERLANSLLAQDDQGQLAETVTTTNNLSGTASMMNPQWLAAMMLQTYSAFRVTGALMKIVQIAGIQEMSNWVTAQTGNTEKLIAYGILADTFNTWLDVIQKTLGTASLAALKLDVSAAVTPANVSDQLAKIPTLLDGVPFGAGYRSGGSVTGVPDDAALTGTGASNFALSFLGTLAQLTLANGLFAETFPQTVDPSTAKYDVNARLGKTGLGVQIVTLALSAAAAQTATDTLVNQLMTTGLPSADKSASSCLVQIAGGAYTVIVSIAQAILSDHSLIGNAVAGNIALEYLNGEVSIIQTCGTAQQNKILKSVQCEIDYLRSTHLYGGNTVALRKIPVTNIPSSTETDQIRDTALSCQNMLCYPLADGGASTKPQAGTIDLFRQIVAGLPFTTTGVPRTFNNAEVAAAGLYFDLLRRNADTLKPDLLTSGKFIFCTANFARLLRRSPGVGFAQLPSITAAALLCSAPNFAPARSGAPMDLTTLSTMGPLTAAADLVPGVPIHVQ